MTIEFGGASSVGTSAPTSATDLAKAEDTAHASGDVGVAVWAVRKDTAAAVAADGDYIPLIVDSTGRLHINDTALLARLGEVQASPTANTVLDRLKTLATSMASASPQGTAWSYAAASGGIVNTTTAVTFKAADASLRNYITSVQIASEALTTATEVAIRDGAGGTVLWRTKISTAGLLNGMSMTFDPPLFSTAATLLEVLTITASGAGAVYFNAQGFVSA